MTKDCRENCHSDQSGECSREYDEARMFHCHESGNQESLVADLGKDYHRQRKNEGM